MWKSCFLIVLLLLWMSQFGPIVAIDGGDIPRLLKIPQAVENIPGPVQALVLTGSESRLQQFKKEWDATRLRFHLVYGPQPGDLHRASDVFSIWWFVRHWWLQFPSIRVKDTGERGVALGHYHVLSTIVAMPEKENITTWYVVLEDDSAPEKLDFTRLVARLPKNAALIQLYPVDPRNHTSYSEDEDIVCLGTPDKAGFATFSCNDNCHCGGTVGYMLTRAKAAELLRLFPISQPIDVAIWYPHAVHPGTYISLKHYVSHRSVNGSIKRQRNDDGKGQAISGVMVAIDSFLLTVGILLVYVLRVWHQFICMEPH